MQTGSQKLEKLFGALHVDACLMLLCIHQRCNADILTSDDTGFA